MNRMPMAIGFAVVIAVCFFAGGILLTSAIGGIVTLVGFVCLIESIKSLKFIMYHFSKLFDIALMVLSIWLTINKGVTIALSLTIAGIGYTMFYAPYIRETYHFKSKDK